MNLIPQAYAQRSIGGTIDQIGPFAIPKSIAEAGSNVADLFSTMLQFFTLIGGLAFIVYFIIGGLKWLTAGDDTQKVDGAKKQMTNAAIGLIIIVLAYGIIAIVGAVLGIPILDPVKMLQGLDSVGDGTPGPGPGPGGNPGNPDGSIIGI
jgi:hypothetical protein